MPRLAHTLAEWIAIAHEVAAPDRDAAPPGLAERIRAHRVADQRLQHQ